jgi:hypothetical protein
MKQEQRNLTFDEAVKAYNEAGWEIMSDGPTGIKFQAPKKMKGLDKACLVFGILTFWFYGLGLIFIVIALIDYCLLTKPESIFLNRK